MAMVLVVASLIFVPTYVYLVAPACVAVATITPLGCWTVSCLSCSFNFIVSSGWV